MDKKVTTPIITPVCSLSSMEETLSREEKRRQKKKQRKKQQRQQLAIQQIQSIQQSASNATKELNENKELEEREMTQDTKTELQMFLPKALCEECKSKSVTFLCQDCGRYYCDTCYQTFHTALQKEKKEFHLHLIDIATNKSTDNSKTIKEKIELVQSSLNTKKHIQHYGLRCKKCFELLVRDDEFLYAGGRLLVNPLILKKRQWKGLHYSGDVVFCCNKHNVGRVTKSTSANDSILFYRLTAEKTTWKENFLENADYANSDIIKEKQIGTTRPLMPCELHEM